VGIPFCEVTYARWARLGHHASIGKKFPDGSKSFLSIGPNVFQTVHRKI